VNWLSTCILPALLALAISAYAQPSSLRVRGNIRSCFAVRILDRQSPIDSLLADSMLIPQGTAVYVMCMASKADVTNVSTSLGDVTSLAGAWHRTVVLSADDGLVRVSPLEISPLDTGDLYQVVVPVIADTVIVDSVVTTTAWDGRTGGVIAIEANVVISDSGSIDMSGLGFRGGARSNNGGSCGVVQACDPATSDRTGGKGESIRLPIASCTNGHTPWANGGGGGDAHNAGGGGGGNGGAGGRGGNQYVCSAVPGMHGMSGMALLDGSQERVFLGGGGGGGHQNNNVATEGARGAGAVMIRAHTVCGDTLTISARGSDAGPRAGIDGGGGGGAGGSVYIDACYAASTVRIDVSGGTGSMCDGGHGPGGGGGGGRVIMHPALLQTTGTRVMIDAQGGKAGLVNSGSGTNGATNGFPGIVRALCREVSPHRLAIAPKAQVGDTILMMMNATDTTNRCEVMITHQVRFVGAAHVPLTSGLSWFDALQVDVQHRDPDTTITTVTLPSLKSWTLPVLAMLSQDSTTVVSHRSWIPTTAAPAECAWSWLDKIITVDACALRIRPIEVGGPSRVRIEQRDSDISVAIESNQHARAICTLYSATGERVASCIASPFGRFTTDNLAAGLYCIIIEQAHGTSMHPLMIQR